jgi:peptidyl-prolyl cis-trans isomerase B (cyclophilin B)
VPVPPRPTNGFAVASFACLMLALGGSIVTCGLTMPIAIPGLVFGHVSLRQIARTGDDGRWMALTGVIAGWILVALVVLLGLSALAIAVLDDGGT